VSVEMLQAQITQLQNQMRDLKNQMRYVSVTSAGADDTSKLHTQQVTYLGKDADTLVMEQYGFHSNAPAGSFGVAFSIQNNPENRLSMVWEPKDRPQLESGEVAFYHPSTDAFIIWRKGGDLDIETGGSGTAAINIKSGNITIDSGDITVTSDDVSITASDVEIISALTTITGNLVVTGTTTLGPTVTSGGVGIGGTHRHNQGVDSNGDTQVKVGTPVP